MNARNFAWHNYAELIEFFAKTRLVAILDR